MNFKKIGFIGLGLIGGSIALKLKELYPTANIIATSHGQSTISNAYKMGIISNQKKLDIKDFSDCDFIYLCAPVENNIEYLSQLKEVISPNCIITDVGSTKTKIHKRVQELGLEANFIGGHPMTGSEKTGIAYANPIFLENAYYIITPTEQTKKEQLDDYIQMVSSFGSIPLVLDYIQHDRATAAISHLPHMIAFSLTNFIASIDDSNETMKTIAAGSFRDMTRVAASSPAMWESIAATNKEQISILMDEYISMFQDLKEHIQNYDKDHLLHFFEEAKNYRDSLNLPGKQVKRLVHEIYLDLNDEAGGIATIATIMAFKNINIKNIGIINNREFEEGVLRIEFYEEHAKEKALKLLKERNYVIHER
ncbi:MAG: prephenate dehydrogenase/arogenate dehydrogenase family protein [Lachnospiraceae bacterium]|nr:prephenate dehydrogenase/arogenate dehydrogenase family protein [Lachnospiraceae bacterium]